VLGLSLETATNRGGDGAFAGHVVPQLCEPLCDWLADPPAALVDRCRRGFIRGAMSGYIPRAFGILSEESLEFCALFGERHGTIA